MYRILVVEDEKAINDLIVMNLTEAGYECDRAFDGMEAADRLEGAGYDLVLLDIMLPGANGYELLDAWFHIAALVAFALMPLMVLRKIRNAMLTYVYIP